MIERNVIVYDQWTFRDDDIHSGNIYLATSLMSDTLEANTFSATVECIDREILDFERNAPLTYYHRGVRRGIYYVQSITRVGPTTYTISATSAIGLLIEGLHYGGIYTGQTVAEVLPSICGTVPYVIKTNLREIALYGWLPIASPRDNLAQVLFAVGAVIKTDLDGVLHIEGLWDGISGTLGRDRMYMGPSVDYASKVTQVVVTEHQYIEGGEQTDLFEGTAQEGDIITFDGPMYDLQATGISILESNANYAKVSAGSGTLKGRAYIHNTRQITQNVLQANEPNIKTVTDATLVSLVNSRAVAEQVANYYGCVETINAPVEYRGENPGDVLSVWHPYDLEAVSACVESTDISMSNTLKAEGTLLVGFKPIKTETTITYDKKEILTGIGTWIPPEGTTSVHAVLIGGAGPGGDGEQGGSNYESCQSDQSGKIVYSSSTPMGETIDINLSANSGFQATAAGEGGIGGSAGIAGSVYEVDIDISGGETFAYQCGDAGTDPTQAGGETIFGEYTSANGGPLPNGYTDLTTGITYALPGADGVKGGNGGSGGQNGEDVATAIGGAGAQGGSKRDSQRYDTTRSFLEIKTTSSASYTISACGGGGAGGGTEDNPGENGGSGRIVVNGNSINAVSASTAGGFAAGGSGGTGANGRNGETYGSAGSGGHGGGGAGASGSYTGSASVSGSATRVNSNTGQVSFEARVGRISVMIPGGSGGNGGSGMPGCIIVYYGVQTTEKSGPIVTSDNHYFLDKYGRRVVV